MKLNVLHSALLAAFVLFASVSCSKSDEDSTTPKDPNNTTVVGDYTVSEQVKTAVLNNSHYNDTTVMLHEEYNNRYYLVLRDARINLVHGFRSAGTWAYHGNSYYPSAYGQQIKDITNGVINSISEITEKIDEEPYPSAYAEFQPGHGYGAYFTTDAGEKKYVRIYAKSYELDGSGNLQSVTIEYQLY